MSPTLREMEEDMKEVAYEKELTWKEHIESMLEQRNDLPEHRKIHIGSSDYSEHSIQPYDIWKEYHLNPWEADIVKRILRTKKGTSRKEDLQKIKHICDELIAHEDEGYVH